MAAKITGTSANTGLSAFFAVASLEQQLIYLTGLLLTAQTTYNTTDPAPTTLINRVAVTPSSNAMIAQATFDQIDGAALVAPYEAVQALADLAALPLDADGADTLSGDAATFAALTSLESQIMFVASKLEAAEAAYNTANPETPVNRVNVASDYNLKRTGFSASLPLASGGFAALTGTYLP